MDSSQLMKIAEELMDLKFRLKIAESELAYVKYREHYYQKARPEVKKETPKPEVKEEPQVKKVSEIEKIERLALDDIEERDYMFGSTKAKAVPRIHECVVCAEKNSYSVKRCTKCDCYVCPKCFRELHEATEESRTNAVLCIRCRVARWKNCPCFKDFAIQCHGKKCTSYGCKECFLAYREGGYFCPSCWEYETHRKPSPRPRPVSDTPETKRILEGWDGN